ncbi:MAG: DNA repair protein RecN, partial [Bacteroidota bacterium]|nr:DNA repair protein RecN [Bacteroidota bacterium]
QVINITHLPQVAAMGNIHFNVEKIDDGDNVKTLINKLDRDSRIQVLAKMLGGDKTGKAALFNAQELLN